MEPRIWQLLLILCALKLIWAYQNGAPMTICGRFIPTGHPNMGTPLARGIQQGPYMLEVFKAKENIYRVTLRSTQGNPFRGFLIQGIPATLDFPNGPADITGTFRSDPNDGWFQVRSCGAPFGQPNAPTVVTHTRNGETYAMETFWEAPSNLQTPVKFIATVVQDSNHFYVISSPLVITAPGMGNGQLGTNRQLMTNGMLNNGRIMPRPLPTNVPIVNTPLGISAMSQTGMFPQQQSTMTNGFIQDQGWSMNGAGFTAGQRSGSLTEQGFAGETRLGLDRLSPDWQIIHVPFDHMPDQGQGLFFQMPTHQIGTPGGGQIFHHQMIQMPRTTGGDFFTTSQMTRFTNRGGATTATQFISRDSAADAGSTSFTQGGTRLSPGVLPFTPSTATFSETRPFPMWTTTFMS